MYWPARVDAEWQDVLVVRQDLSLTWDAVLQQPGAQRGPDNVRLAEVAHSEQQAEVSISQADHSSLTVTDREHGYN